MSGAGPRRWGEERGSWGRCPPPPLCVPRGLLPRDARAEGAAPGPRSPEGCAGAAPLPPLPLPGGRPGWSPLLNAAKVLGSCGPAGSPLALPTRWAPAGASSRPGQRPLPRLPVHGRAPWEPLGPPGQRLQPGREPRPRPGCLDQPPQHLPREGASFLPFTFRRYLEGIYRCREQPPPSWLPQGPRFWTRSPINPCCLQTREILAGWDGGTQIGVCMRGNVGGKQKG